MEVKIKEIIRTRSWLIHVHTAIKDGYWHYTINSIDHIIRFGIIRSHKEMGTVTSICFLKWRLIITRCAKGYEIKKKCSHLWEENPELPENIVSGAYGTRQCTMCGKIERLHYPIGHLKHRWE